MQKMDPSISFRFMFCVRPKLFVPPATLDRDGGNIVASEASKFSSSVSEVRSMTPDPRNEAAAKGGLLVSAPVVPIIPGPQLLAGCDCVCVKPAAKVETAAPWPVPLAPKSSAIVVIAPLTFSVS